MISDGFKSMFIIFWAMLLSVPATLYTLNKGEKMETGRFIDILKEVAKTDGHVDVVLKLVDGHLSDDSKDLFSLMGYASDEDLLIVESSHENLTVRLEHKAITNIIEAFDKLVEQEDSDESHAGTPS